MIDLFI